VLVVALIALLALLSQALAQHAGDVAACRAKRAELRVVGRKKLVMRQPGKYGATRPAQVRRRSFDKLPAGETSPRRREVLGPASGVVANHCNR
jgi:hypothetical protein